MTVNEVAHTKAGAAEPAYPGRKWIPDRRVRIADAVVNPVVRRVAGVASCAACLWS
ncbi:MAG: hypothetical protein HC872_02820 [Gammaproteobacteria bacterium]|nr:hypothetical protein [Gammaproteobacteria bacterium]